MLFTLPAPPDFMSALRSPKGDGQRPGGLASSKSFRSEPVSPTKTRPTRASTIHNGAIPDIDFRHKMLPENRDPSSRSTVFAKMPETFNQELEDGDNQQEEVPASIEKLSTEHDDLPIELISLVDRCVCGSHCASSQIDCR